MMLDQHAYFARIGYRGALAPGAQMLRELHRTHVMNVPFENLDIHRGRAIGLDPEAHFQKVVGERRGGFCYELNLLLATILRQLGFAVATLSARVFDSDGNPGRDFAHLLSMVQLEERWLVDVAFGDTFLEPLRLDERAEQCVGGRSYRFAGAHNDRRELQVMEPTGIWRTRYAFSLTPRSTDEFAPMCFFQQSSPESQFVRKRLCTRATTSGRITLSGRTLIRTDGLQREETAIENEQQFAASLREHFDLDLPADGWTRPL